MNADKRVVFDCNTLPQAIASPSGPAGRCVQLAFDGVVQFFISPKGLQELRDVSSRPRVVAMLRLTPERVERFFEAIESVAIFIEQYPQPFAYDRDPDDADYVNLAVAAKARLIVTRDKDLLDLMDPARPEGEDFQSRFPNLRIVTPPQSLIENNAA